MLTIIDTMAREPIYNRRILNKIKGPIVKVGYIQRWNGRNTGFDYLKRIDDAVSSEYDVELVEDDDGILKMYEKHHDGTNYYELYHPCLDEEEFVEEIYSSAPHKTLESLIEHVREYSEPIRIDLISKRLKLSRSE